MTDARDRSRTVRWDDPLAGADLARQMSGLRYIEAIQRGEMPSAPMASLMGLSIAEVEEGRVVFAVEPAEYHYNPIGAVHGGLACTISDSAMGCAVHTTLPAGVGYTTLELKTNLLRAITLDSGRLLCEGRTLHVGGRTATAEASLTDASGRLCAHATTTCLLFRPEAGR